MRVLPGTTEVSSLPCLGVARAWLTPNLGRTPPSSLRTDALSAPWLT